MDRPDLVARVFHAKQQALLKIIRDGYFGEVAGFVYTIEYQKHGLPHMHLLVFLEEHHKIRTVEPLYQHSFLIPTFILNSTLLSPDTCSMVLALLRDILRTMFAKSTFPRPLPIRP